MKGNLLIKCCCLPWREILTRWDPAASTSHCTAPCAVMLILSSTAGPSHFLTSTHAVTLPRTAASASWKYSFVRCVALCRCARFSQLRKRHANVDIMHQAQIDSFPKQLGPELPLRPKSTTRVNRCTRAFAPGDDTVPLYLA